MAQPYTDQEVETAVERIVRSSIRRPIGSLGARDTGVTFNDFQEQTTAVLTLTPSAPFYVVRLGCGRLDDKVQSLSDVCDNIDEAAVALGRPSTAVVSTASLANAKVAAEAMSLAGTSRSSQFLDVEKLPAFQRLDRNIAQFLNEYSAPNLRRGGQLVRTPLEGQQLLPGFIRDLKEQRADLIDNVTALANSIADYEALNLPHLLSSGIVERAAQVIDDRNVQMAALSAEGRVAVLRDATLDLIAARSLIRSFSSLSTPTLFLPSNGAGGVYADLDHPAVPASLTVPLPSAYATRVDTVAIDNQLDFLIDGTVRRAVSTGGSFLAALTGLVPETYKIDLGVNDQITVVFRELGIDTPVVVTLTAGLTQTAQDICDDINAVMTQPIEAVPAIVPLKFNGRVDIAGTDPAAVTFSFPLFVQSNWTSIGILEGDKIRVLEGANTSVLYQVNIGGVSATTLTCTRLTGAGTTPQTNQLIEAGGPGFTVKIKITDAYAATALANRSGILVGVVGDPVEVPTCATLGLTAGTSTTSRPLPAQTVVDAVNSSSTTAVSGVSRLNASVTITPVYLSIGVHTEPSRPTVAFIYRFRGRGDITIGGLVATFSLPTLTNVSIGDELVIRATLNQADVNQRGTVTSVSGIIVTALFLTSITTATDVLVDIAPDLTGLPRDTVVVIGPGINTGTYRVISQGSTIKSELQLNRSWSNPQGFSGQPVEMVGDVSQEFLTVASTTQDLTTAIQLDDGSPINPYSAAYLFAPTRPVSAVGTTPWFSLEDLPKDIQVGDIIELHLTGYDVVDYAVTVTSIDGNVVGIDPALPTTTPSVPFQPSALFPFGRIRRVRRDNFNQFETDAKAWLARPQLQPHWLGELDRLVTTVLSEPTPARINDLRSFIHGLAGILTIAEATALVQPTDQTIEAIAKAYQADVVSEIDTLVQSLLQQGADRAVDILLQGRFSQYFGFSLDQMSYAGNVLALTKQVMQQDLPVRAVRRGELKQRQVSLGSFEEPDYEYDQRDIDTGLVPDAPGGNPPPRQGDAY